MSTTNNRNFNCKDEELPIVAKFVAFSLKRDLADFTAFSPLFTAGYVTNFETQITTTSELLEPASETLAKSLITKHYTATIEGLTKPISAVSGYLSLAAPDLKITDAAFGLGAVRKAIDKNDVEAVVDTLHIVLSNIATYKVPLAAKGLTDEFIAGLVTTAQSLVADKQQQYEITSNRRSIVQNNISVFNAVWTQTSEILKIGKVLYKGTNPAKLADYTYADLLRKVRQVSKATPKDAAATDTTTTE